MAPLPPKQTGTFKKILKCYDYKQYKMGLKLAKQILSNPETANHGETLAMKGLILNCMGKKDEAYEHVRRGLRNDLTSHVCWHVYGLLQRSEHKYDEAIKCYRNALKYDKDNITILRDLSLLQIQMRDLEGFRDTRYQLFMLRSAQRVSWLSFATAYHLLKDYGTAAKILDEFRRTQKQQKDQNDTAPSPSGASTTATTTGADSRLEDKESLEKRRASHPEPIDYEQSELLLYQVMILYEASQFKEALDFLNRHSSQICDRLDVLEFRASILLALGRNAESAKLLQEQLIPRNQENNLYYTQLEKALNLDPHDEVYRLSLYQSLQQKYPRSQLPFKIPLKFVENPDRFRKLVGDYLKRGIVKCLPSLFRNMKPVYQYEFDRQVGQLNQKYVERLENDASNESDQKVIDQELIFIELGNGAIEDRKTRSSVFERHGIPAKIKLIEDLVLSYEVNLKENVSFESDPSTKDSENKTSILWVYYYLAQHYDYMGQYDKALEYVRVAIDHTPTLIELLTLKGKIYKHMGEFDKAVEQVNEAQRLDTADRYLNSKCSKYMLRANKIQDARDMCSKFTRTGVSVTDNLNEMQCMWFHLETARAHFKMKEYGEALKKCYEIDAYFSEVTEDQFDFHTYCMRKMTLRSYIQLLRMEDVLRSHRFFFKAAKIAIDIYLHLYDDPLVEGKENQKAGQGENALSAAELKKIKSKERKAAAKLLQNQKHGNKAGTGGNSGDTGNKGNKANSNTNQQNNGNSSKQSQTNDSNSGLPGNPNDAAGFDPQALAHPKDPLEKALRFLTPLKLLATNKLDTQLLAFEVYKRKNKLLLMLQSVKRAHRLNPHHSKLRKQLSEFFALVDRLAKEGQLTEPIVKVLDIELPKLRQPTRLECPNLVS